MFGTLLGGLPRPIRADGTEILDDDAAVVVALDEQARSGLGPYTDGRLRWRNPFGPIAGLAGVVSGPTGVRLTGAPRWRTPLSVEAWRFAADHSDGFVSQALPGPYTLGRRLGRADPGVANYTYRIKAVNASGEGVFSNLLTLPLGQRVLIGKAFNLLRAVRLADDQRVVPRRQFARLVSEEIRLPPKPSEHAP